MLTSFALNDSGVTMYGRLKPAISMKAAVAALEPLSKELAREHPEAIQEGQGLIAEPGGYAAHGALSSDDAIGFALFGALALLILCVACSNLGNLLLGHAITRGREVAIRLALGATPGRIARQFMTENLLLALVGSATGLLLSVYASRIMVVFLGGPRHISFAPDWRTTLCSLALGVLASVIFGMPPARHAARQLQQRSRVRTLFMGAQVAASCVLLVLAALLVRGLYQVFNSDLGFDYKHVVVVDPELYAHGYTPAKAAEFMRELQARTAEEPGVASMSLAYIAPMGHRLRVDFTTHVYINSITPGYFKTLSVPILGGRDFTEKDADGTIVSQSYAKKFWPGRDPLRQTVKWNNKQLPVIAIAANAPIMALRDASASELYLVDTGNDLVSSVMLVKTSQPPESIAASLGKIAGSLDSVLSPSAYPLKDSFDDKVSASQKIAGVVTGLGALAFSLALIGLWGVVSYTVAQRTKEIGIRVALGATPGRIVETMVSRFIMPVSLSLAVGTGLAALLSIALRRELYGLSNFDIVSYVGAVVLLAVASGVAALIPARRALKVDPIVALRSE
jgi:predicted permease